MDVSTVLIFVIAVVVAFAGGAAAVEWQQYLKVNKRATLIRVISKATTELGRMAVNHDDLSAAQARQASEDAQLKSLKDQVEKL